jgi:glycerophosphoryl diester phosphodiesterase
MCAQISHPFLAAPGAIAIAHRGGALEAEENTLPAFANAVALGYSHVELDVHVTRDGVVVIHHDPDLMRLCDDPRMIAALDYAQLRQIRTRAGAEIPTLEALLSDFPTLYVVIEVKARAAVAPLCDLIARLGALDRVCIGGFDPAATAEAVARLGPGLLWSPAHAQVARLLARGWGLALPLAGFGVVQIPMRWKGLNLITPRFMRAAHRAGVAVQVWTINEGAEMAHLLDLGVDGVITDKPALLRKVLERRAAWGGLG